MLLLVHREEAAGVHLGETSSENRGCRVLLSFDVLLFQFIIALSYLKDLLSGQFSQFFNNGDDAHVDHSRKPYSLIIKKLFSRYLQDFSPDTQAFESQQSFGGFKFI